MAQKNLDNFDFSLDLFSHFGFIYLFINEMKCLWYFEHSLNFLNSTNVKI